jgi:CheY-like chemotaxis protein
MKKIESTFVIDDDPIVLMISEHGLSRHEGFAQVSYYSNAQDALAQLQQPEAVLPSLILLDLNMPLMDGWEFMERISRMPEASKIPVIIFTSSIDPEDIARSKTFAQVRGYVAKPLTHPKIEEIYQTVAGMNS